MIYSYSNKKGQFILKYCNTEFENVTFIFHSNYLTPFVDTMHFGTKPGQFSIFTKKWNEEGKWFIEDNEYENYFRKDNKQIISNRYNTLGKQKLFSKGFLRYCITTNSLRITSLSILPIHRRVIDFNFKHNTLKISDNFFGKGSVYFHTFTGLIKDESWFYSKRTFNLK